MASGDLLHQWQAKDGEPPSSSFAALTRRNNHFLLAYDAASEEACDFSGVLSRRYSGGGLTLTLAWAAASATTGDVKWGAKIERHQDDVDDLDADSFATEQVATGTTASLSGELQYTAITFTAGANMDSLAVGEDFRLRISRKAADAADTMTGDAQLKSLELRET